MCPQPVALTCTRERPRRSVCTTVVKITESLRISQEYELGRWGEREADSSKNGRESGIGVTRPCLRCDARQADPLLTAVCPEQLWVPITPSF